MSKNNKIKSRVKSKRRIKRRFWVIIPLLIILVAGGSYIFNLYSKAEKAADGAFDENRWTGSELREEDVDPDFDNVSILLLGIDQNEKRAQKEIPRTDAMVLATLNKEEKSIKLLSIPRDSLVYIPQVGYEDKINHAYAFGEAAKTRYQNGEHFDSPPSGTKASIETVQQLFDIPIDYYVQLNFEAFIDVIDAIGGISMDVPYELVEMDSNDNKKAIHLSPGIQTLDGEETLALARTRKLDSDFERGKRQMEIIDAIIKKSTSISSVLKYGDVIDALGDNLSTNMAFNDMKKFLNYAMSGSGLNVEKITLDGDDYQPNRVYYWKLNEESLEETKTLLKNHLEVSHLAEVDENKLDEQTNANKEDPKDLALP